MVSLGWSTMIALCSMREQRVFSPIPFSTVLSGTGTLHVRPEKGEDVISCYKRRYRKVFNSL